MGNIGNIIDDFEKVMLKFKYLNPKDWIELTIIAERLSTLDPSQKERLLDMFRKTVDDLNA